MSTMTISADGFFLLFFSSLSQNSTRSFSRAMNDNSKNNHPSFPYLAVILRLGRIVCYSIYEVMESDAVTQQPRKPMVKAKKP
jgi:hypothetical protein